MTIAFLNPPITRNRTAVTVLRTYTDLGGTARVRLKDDSEMIVRQEELDYRSRETFQMDKRVEVLRTRVSIFKAHVGDADFSILKPSKFDQTLLQGAAVKLRLSLRTMFRNLREARKLGLI